MLLRSDGAKAKFTQKPLQRADVKGKRKKFNIFIWEAEDSLLVCDIKFALLMLLFLSVSIPLIALARYVGLL
jgi:hypothetical protein